MEFAVEDLELLKASLNEGNPRYCKQCKEKELLKICLKTLVDLLLEKNIEFVAEAFEDGIKC